MDELIPFSIWYGLKVFHGIDFETTCFKHLIGRMKFTAPTQKIWCQQFWKRYVPSSSKTFCSTRKIIQLALSLI